MLPVRLGEDAEGGGVDLDERGRGLILRGARARTDHGDRHPYLEREDAYDLLVRAIKAYRGHWSMQAGYRHQDVNPQV